MVIVGQVITAGFDKKILSWDTRMVKNPVFLENLGSEMHSMSLSGFDMVIAIGPSVHTYDLRSLERPFQSTKLDMGMQIKCISSYTYSKGMITIFTWLCMYM